MNKQYAYIIAIHFIVSFSSIGLAQMQGPDFLIIGAQKCGTTSLYNYLIEHPNIIPAIEKKINFFTSHFSKDVEWYQAQLNFKLKKDNLLIGEATPYYFFHPLVPQRVAQLFPDVKLIVLLRNPAQRAFSNYKHNTRTGKEKLSFEQAINSETERLQGEREKMLADATYQSRNYKQYSYLARGIYIDQIKHWMNYFPKEQFLIIQSEEFFADPEAILKKVHTFLGIQHYPLNNYSRYNPDPDSIKPDEKVMTQLADYFRPYNKALEEFLGRKFNWDEE